MKIPIHGEEYYPILLCLLGGFYIRYESNVFNTTVFISYKRFPFFENNLL